MQTTADCLVSSRLQRSVGFPQMRASGGEVTQCHKWAQRPVGQVESPAALPKSLSFGVSYFTFPSLSFPSCKMRQHCHTD